MAYKETFWMACDSTEQLRAEYGPFQTRAEAEGEARKLGFGYLLRYEHIIGENDEIQEVRCIFVELAVTGAALRVLRRLHTRCATCGESAAHDEAWRAEVWPISTNLSTHAIASACLSRRERKACVKSATGEIPAPEGLYRPQFLTAGRAFC